MRALILVLLAASMHSARAESIEEVLDRSHQVRLQTLPVVDAESDKARTVRASFDALLAVAKLPVPVELRVITGQTVAETLRGGIVVANEVLADLTEGERRFVLAHEISHVALGHWAQMGQLYRHWVPGMVHQEQTDAVASLLGGEASRLSHRQEFEADGLALQLLTAAGGTPQDALSAFMRLGSHPGSATHPSTRHRVAALRSRQESVQP